VRDFAQHLDRSLTHFEAAHSQARRADKSNAGGVSHRYANIRPLTPGGPTQERMYRPFRPATQWFLQSGGSRHRQRMCRASSP